MRCAVAIAIGAIAGDLGAQDVSAPLRVPCNGQTISEIRIVTQPPEYGSIFARWRFLRNSVARLHVTTREEVIRRFLLLKDGDACRELRRSETERILLAQPFLADATVHAEDDGGGGVRIVVTTIDEVSALGALGVAGTKVTVLKLGNANVAGDGVFALGEWRDGGVYRDLWGASFTDHQLGGRAYQLTVEGARRPVGGEWRALVAHPFLTDLQRVAWRVTAGESRSFTPFRIDADNSPSLSVRRRYADLGGIIRIGEPGRLSLFGASLSHEAGSSDSLAVIMTDSGLVRADAVELDGAYGRHRTARANLLWGVRNIKFDRVMGFDALFAPQDVRRGFQLGVLFGRGLSVLGSDDDDIALAGDLYMGAGGRRSFVALQARGEGRQDYDRNRWDGVLAGGRAAWYLKPSPSHTAVLSLDGGAGWRQRVPFQLTAADRDGGIRGHGASKMGGAQRAVVRLEDRWAIGTLRKSAGLGVAAYVDAGRLRAGDSPYGVDSPLLAGAGIGILIALPPRSKRMWRLDVAYPIAGARDGERRIDVRLRANDFTRRFWKEPRDLRRGRERSVPSSIFNWP